MPKLATMIGRYRRDYSAEQLLIVDCGDHLDRVRLETEGSRGLSNIEVMNATGYDVFVPGNNEGLTFPKPIMESVFREHANFTVLGTNMYDLRSGQVPSWMTDGHIVVKNGVRIGLIGVTASYNDFYHPLGWDVRDPFQAAVDAIGELRDKVDFLIVISHVGLPFDRRLAEQVSGIDCIIGGHTHHLMEQAERVGTTLIGAAGKYGTHLGVVEAAFDVVSNRLLSLGGYALPSEGEAADIRITDLIERNLRFSLSAMDRQVTVLAEPIPHNVREESELGNLLADALRKWTESDIGIVNAGQLLDGLSAGRQTDADFLAICPSPINPCSIRLLGADIRQALEEALLDEYIDQTIRGYGFRGKQLGTLCLSGIEVDYDRSSREFDKIKAIRIHHEPLSPDRLYKVGTIDMFTFGIGYLTLSKGQDTIYYLPEFIRDVLKKELIAPGAILVSKKPRWKPV